jgi:hypothetical protein
MIKGIVNDAMLAVKHNLGSSVHVVIWSIIVLATGVGAAVWLSIAAFVWLTQRYDTIVGAAALGGAFLLISIAALSACIVVRRCSVAKVEAREKAEAAAEQIPSWLLDPRVAAVGLEFGRVIGFKRLIPLAAVGILIALGSRDWSASQANEPAE